MFLESDFKLLEKETLKEAEEEKSRIINEAETKIKKEKETFLKTLDIEKEKKLLEEKYAKTVKEKKLLIEKKYVFLYKRHFNEKYNLLKSFIMDFIQKEKTLLVKCFIEKLEKEYPKGELFIPMDLNINSKFEIKKHKLETVIFKFERKNIVLDFEEIVKKSLKSLKW